MSVAKRRRPQPMALGVMLPDGAVEVLGTGMRLRVPDQSYWFDAAAIALLGHAQIPSGVVAAALLSADCVLAQGTISRKHLDLGNIGGAGLCPADVQLMYYRLI